MKSFKHWQDVANMLLGLCLAISPWAMGYADMPLAMGSAVIAGLVLVGFTLGAIVMPRAWEEWGEVLVGLWMVVAPWLLRFADYRAAMLSSVVIGVLVIALAVWTLVTDKDYMPALHRDHVTH